MSEPFLFTLSSTEQDDLFEAAATRTGLPAYVIEKDYYVTLVLKLLFEKLKPLHTQHTPTPFMFKGGTTLSKVFGCINRMSEDVDLSLDMNFLGHPEPSGKESNSAIKRRVNDLEQATIRTVSTVMVPFLQSELQKLNDGFTINTTGNGMDIEVFYPSRYRGGGYVTQRVLIECGGKAGLEPSDSYTVCPIALEEIDPHLDACSVDVLGADRTFFEKITALHEINHRGPTKLGDRQARHIYDVVAIHQKFPDFVNRIDLLRKVVEHKAKYFRRSASKWEEARPGSLFIMPSTGENGIRELLAKDWEKMHDMFPAGLPMTFEAMLAQLAVIDRTLNFRAIGHL